MFEYKIWILYHNHSGELKDLSRPNPSSVPAKNPYSANPRPRAS